MEKRRATCHFISIRCFVFMRVGNSKGSGDMCAPTVGSLYGTVPCYGIDGECLTVTLSTSRPRLALVDER